MLNCDRCGSERRLTSKMSSSVALICGQSIVVVALRQAAMSYQMSHWGSLVSTVEVNATV